MLQGSDFLPMYVFNMNVNQFGVLNLWDLQLHKFMNTNGTLSVWGVHQFFTEFFLKQKLVFGRINLVKDTDSGPVKLAEVVLIPGFVSVLPFLSQSVC